MASRKRYAAMKVFTDGDSLFVASSLREARALFIEAFGGDTPRDYGVRLRKLPPMAIVALMDDEEKVVRMRAYTLAKGCPTSCAFLAE